MVQSTRFLGLSTVLIAPTSTTALPTSFRPSIDVEGQLTQVLVEQTTAFDLDRIGGFAGRLSGTERRAVDEALRLVLAL